MESVEALQTPQQEQKQQPEKDQVVATHDVTDRKQETDGSVLVEEVSLVEEEVKISAVVDSAVAAPDAAVSEFVEETSSSVVETISESQPLETVSLDELSSLIDLDVPKGVADETNEEKAVPPITPVKTNAAVVASETKDAAVAADAESIAAESTKTSVSINTTNKVEEDASAAIASAKKDDADAAASRAPDLDDASPTTEEMDIDVSVKPTADNKKKQSSKEPARKGKQGKEQQPVKAQESEDEEEYDDIMEEEYEVEKIAGHRVFKGKVVKYIVKWKGYPSSENTTENATTMHADVPELCAAYWATCKEKRPDNVPQVATEELKPLLDEQQQNDQVKVKIDAGNDSDASDDETYKPESKARSPSPVATTSPAASSRDKAGSATPIEVEEEEPRTRSRRATPGLSTFTASNSSTSSDTSAPDTSTAPKQSNQPIPNNKRKRATSSSAPESSHVKKFKKNMEHVPDYMVKLGYQFPNQWPNKQTEWDVDVKKVCVQVSPIDSKVRFTYIEWNNGERTIHSMKEAHEMIPEKLIHYYEERLQFV